MDMKTLTGSSIQAALAKAREQLGEHVVLIESTPATDDRPAQITVMVDGPVSETATGVPSRKRVPKPPAEVPSSSSGPGRQARTSSSDSHTETRTQTTAQTSTTAEQLQKQFGADSQGDSGGPMSRQQGTGRGRLFPVSGKKERADGRRSNRRETFVEARRRQLKDRRGSSGLVRGDGSAERWAAHPLFGRFLDEGMRPETIAQLFDDLAERDVDLENNDLEDLRWAFSQVLCRRIEVASEDRGKGAFAVIGPGGVGKTSLILKLATNDGLLNGEAPAVIHVLPEDDRDLAYQNPTELYQRFGIPVQGVRSRDELTQALGRVKHLGQVIIDTPSLPLPLEEARPVLRRYEYLLQPLLPMDVCFVMNAMHAVDAFDPESLQQLPITPSTAALTHLDETVNWGRVAEWLLELDLPAQFVSDGPGVPDGARAFSLKWFVEDVMDL